ncbi:MAG: CBS domain-containing protein [Candidatus Thermoplasmatota archaeon]|jgi:CBS domain-containing protein|nr:CBS domain-containing protein [Candidatus Thermoplasmatota archaeon]MCL5793905.1 CBS domain-containing protein [Candidatus Thermoplasmatota archaeon]
MAVPVSDIMTKKPSSYHAPSTVDELVGIFIKKKVTGFPITDSSGKYIGMVSRRDIFDNTGETQTAMLMRKARAVKESDPVDVAAAEIVTQRRRHLAVVDNQGYLKGILTPQNFMDMLIQNHKSVPVSRFLATRIVPVYDRMPVSLIPEISRITGIYTYPVLKAGGIFAGLITDRDIFEKAEVSTETIVSEFNISSDEDPWTWDGVRNLMPYIMFRSNVKLPETEISEIMIKNPYTVLITDTVEKVATIMKKGNFNQVPVMETREKLAGIIYDIDLMGAFV